MKHMLFNVKNVLKEFFKQRALKLLLNQ